MAIFQPENHAGLSNGNQNKPEPEFSGVQFNQAFQNLPSQG
jgi:hypothetical protein